MQNTFSWIIQKKFQSENNLLCPSPIIINDSCFIFFGEQLRSERKASIKCFKLNSSLESLKFEVRFEVTTEHSCSNGNLPNSLYDIAGKGVFLICAEFSESINHKHRLIAHLHKVEFYENYCLVKKRIDLDFIDYKEDRYHTVAGMSYFEGEYLFAMGSSWEISSLQTTPITNLYRFNLDKNLQTELMVPSEHKDLALARPIMLRWNNLKLLTYSARSSEHYSSKIFYLFNDLAVKVHQNFYLDSVHLQEKSLAYQYPFMWKGRLWCLCTLDFRGTEGFYMFRLEDD